MKTGIALALAAIGALSGTAASGGFHMPIVGGYSPPKECTMWYDGCNMCQRTGDSGVSCTDRVCSHQGKGFCVASPTPAAATGTSSAL